MTQPINYMAAMPQIDLSQSFAGLGKALGEYRDYQEKQKKDQAEADLKAQYADDVKAYFAKPSASGLSMLTAKYPGQREAFKDIGDRMSAEQKAVELPVMAQAFHAITTGKPDAAKLLVDQQIEGMQNSGMDATKLKMIRSQLDSDPTQVAGLIGLVGSSIDPDGWGKMMGEKRAQDLQPSLVRKGVAEAGAAESDTSVKATEAKYADQKARAALDEAAAQLGLTKAQTNQAKAAASKLSAETNQLVAEAASGGDPSKRFEAEQKLRKEYSDQTKPFVEVKEAYRRVQASDNTGPGDIALIYGYMKMLDPGSVVREGEFATASNSSGVPVAIQNLYNKAISGQRLTDGQRKTFKSQAGKLAGAAEIREKEVRGGIETVAKSYKLNTANIFGTAATSDSGAPAPGQPKPNQPTQTAVNPQTGERLILRNGKWEPM